MNVAPDVEVAPEVEVAPDVDVAPEVSDVEVTVEGTVAVAVDVTARSWPGRPG